MEGNRNRPASPNSFFAPAISFLLPLLVYVLTLAPTVFNLDSAELTTAAATGGLTRATGYPLYLMLGWLWSKLPIGDVGYRMNLLSAVSAALTLLLCERILLRLGVRPVARLAAVGLLAFSKYFWQLALIAEVYTLQTAIMAGIILAVLRWSDQPSPRRFGLVGLCVGLGLSHHMSTVLLLPGVAFFIVASHPRQVVKWKNLAAGLVGGLAGLAFYLYLPLRYLAQPAFNYAGVYDAAGIFHAENLASISGIWRMMTGASFSPMMFGYPGAGVWQETRQFLVFLAGSFLAIGIGPGILGAWQLYRSKWKIGVMSTLMFVGHALFFINYRAIDKELMYLPAYLIWTFWIGLGFELILAWNDREPLNKPIMAAKKQVNAANLVLSGVLAAAVIFALILNWRLVDLSNNRDARKLGQEILETLPPEALYFGYWDTVPVVQYLQLVEDQRPDVQAINRFLIAPQAMVEWIRRDLNERPVFVDSLPGGLQAEAIALPAGPIYRIKSR